MGTCRQHPGRWESSEARQPQSEHSSRSKVGLQPWAPLDQQGSGHVGGAEHGGEGGRGQVTHASGRALPHGEQQQVQKYKFKLYALWFFYFRSGGDAQAGDADRGGPGKTMATVGVPTSPKEPEFAKKELSAGVNIATPGVERKWDCSETLIGTAKLEQREDFPP
jgi:hypothetical protein